MVSGDDTVAGCAATVDVGADGAVALRRLRLVDCDSGSTTDASRATSVDEGSDGGAV